MPAGANQIPIEMIMRTLLGRSTSLVCLALAGMVSLEFAGVLPAAEIPRSDPPQTATAATNRLDGASQQWRGRFGGQERGVYKSQITPHWFQNNTRFWYRNDLRAGAKEFIVVDAERATRGRAFDHETVAKKIGEGVEPTRLPINELRFSDDAQKVTLVGPDKSWELNVTTGELLEAPAEKPAATGLPPETRPRPSQRTGPETQIEFDNRLSQPVEIFWIDPEGNRQSYGKLEAGARRDQHTFSGHVWLVVNDRGENLAVFEAADTPGLAVIEDSRSGVRERRPGRDRDANVFSGRSPDDKWIAFVKDHNVFIKSRDDEKEIQLSNDGREGLAYGRPSWAPDSRTLVAFRIEPGERKEVYLVQSSPPGGGRAKLQTRPYALPGDKFATYELNLFAAASRKQIKPEVDRFEHEWLAPRLRWRK